MYFFAYVSMMESVRGLAFVERSRVSKNLPDQRAHEGRSSFAGTPRSHPAPVVLVVEHDSAVADALATLLENSGCVAIETADGKAALTRVQNADVDLVLLDLDAPALLGLDLCREIWAAAREGELPIPILVLTSTTRSEDICAGYAAGADDYVSKPFHPAVLLARVRILLRMRALALAALRPPALQEASGDFKRPFQQWRPALAPGHGIRVYADPLRVAGPTLGDRPAPPIPDRETLLPGLIERMTPREQQVLELLARRYRNPEIGELLCVSPQTVAKHTNNIYQKLGVSGRRQAVTRAQALGILPSALGLADSA
jgi:DNA-binding NarL/FixJ family response regulator